MDLADLRLSYTLGGLTGAEALTDPFGQFALWFDQARTAGNPEPNAMALATVSASGAPGVRMVLLKGVAHGGFVFFTNYESRKASDLAANPGAALLFYWPELERQVRINGLVAPVSREESEAYFHSRPRGHQLGAWASRQSAVIAGRETLEQNLAAAEQEFAELDEHEPVPLPPFWGGYRLTPDSFEFWQGRANRLHDRIEYIRQANEWSRRRLSP
ncbi:MAG: pyridoxamine 5'-phosphate oxidase [Bryobacteraceae bacterium]|nr:pyridoxamine 5'-phosphate oxidase [Bryobacteraceae bacterium]